VFLWHRKTFIVHRNTRSDVTTISNEVLRMLYIPDYMEVIETKTLESHLVDAFHCDPNVSYPPAHWPTTTRDCSIELLLSCSRVPLKIVCYVIAHGRP